MKTDDLVAMLSTSVEPVDRRLVARTVGVAVAAASVFALGITVIGLGIRPDLMTARAFTFLLLKLVFTIVIIGLALIYLTRLARPGGEQRTPSIVIAMPFGVIALLAAISLGFAPRWPCEELPQRT